MKNNKGILFATILSFLPLFSSEAFAAKVLDCYGNIETFDKQLLSPGVHYKIWFEISGDDAKVRVAGRELEAFVVHGKSWAGDWIRNTSDKEYLSFLPDEGGTIKLKLNPELWFSGNCL